MLKGKEMNSNILQRTSNFVGTLALSLLCSFSASANLEQDFKNPPESGKPRTWVHSMSGNMSKVGFTKDLEAIAEAGMGGVLLFNVTHGIPTGNVRFHSQDHHDILTHAAKESERLGLSYGIHNCDGWTSSGGPWITPENSMKMLLWSEKVVDGGKINLQLPQPTKREDYFQDVAVLAYPSLAAELVDETLKPHITASDPTFDVSLMTDQRWDVQSILHVKKGEQGYIQFEYESPVTINGVIMSLFKKISGSRYYTIATSDDGKTFKNITERQQLKRLAKKEFAIDHVFKKPVTARYFRIITEDDYKISEVALKHRPQYEQFLAQVSLFKKEITFVIGNLNA